MIVDAQRLPLPQSGRSMTTGVARSDEPLFPPEQNRPPEAQDERPIALVPPPVMLARIFPGL
jgi:hypothetical protein